MKRPYPQIDLDKRRKIERWHHAGVSVTVIAEKLGRLQSSILRELRRCSFRDKEMPARATQTSTVTLQNTILCSPILLGCQHSQSA